jgi:hypothetical protein
MHAILLHDDNVPSLTPILDAQPADQFGVRAAADSGHGGAEVPGELDGGGAHRA